MNPIQARSAAAAILARPKYVGGLWLDTRLHWTEQSKAQLEVLCAAGSDVNKAADALGRSPSSIAHGEIDVRYYPWWDYRTWPPTLMTPDFEAITREWRKSQDVPPPD